MTRTLTVLATALSLSGPALADEKLNDAKIATIGLVAHEIDVERGKLAAAHTHDSAVKQFAQQMVDDHTQGRKDILDLATRLKVTPEESAVTRSLKEGAAKTAAQLGKLKGAAFDRAYIDAEVAYHQAVIDAVHNVLLPNVQNAEVKQLLVSTGVTLDGHLTHAKGVQKLVSGHAAR